MQSNTSHITLLDIMKVKNEEMLQTMFSFGTKPNIIIWKWTILVLGPLDEKSFLLANNQDYTTNKTKEKIIKATYTPAPQLHVINL